MSPVLRLIILVMLCLSLFAPAARAEFALGETGLTMSATPTLTTDYLFRGISQTRNRPAAQLTAEIGRGGAPEVEFKCRKLEGYQYCHDEDENGRQLCNGCDHVDDGCLPNSHQDDRMNDPE